MTLYFDTHGRLKCATITTPLFVRSLNDYRRVLKLEAVEDGVVSAEQAEAWAAPDSAGKRYALLQPKSGAACFLRLIEGTCVDTYQAARSFGWASINMSVSDVLSLYESIEADGAFSIITGPAPIAGIANTTAMSVGGQAAESLTLIQFDKQNDDMNFSSAGAPANHICLATLAAPDRQCALDHYINAFGLTAGITQAHVRPIINLAFGLPEGFQTSVSVLMADRLPVLEIEQYPAGTDVRPMRGSELPPGLSIMTIAVRNLDEIEDDFLTEPCVRHGPLYAGRRTATVMGPADELIELIEIG
jgi:hypothetical protein